MLEEFARLLVALSISLQRLVLSYIKMTNLSTTLIVSSGIEGGVKDKVNSASVDSGKEFHVTHAIFFP